jgi:hypothetical protein
MDRIWFAPVLSNGATSTVAASRTFSCSVNWTWFAAEKEEFAMHTSIKWFGEAQGRPICDERVATPTGRLCSWCDEPIEAADQGVVVPCVVENRLDDTAWHYECWLRQLAGSVAHIRQKCSCFIPGSDENDPPGMTRREAAHAAERALALSMFEDDKIQ